MTCIQQQTDQTPKRPNNQTTKHRLPTLGIEIGCTEAPIYFDHTLGTYISRGRSTVPGILLLACLLSICVCVCVMKSPPADERQPTLLALLLLCDELSYIVHIRYVPYDRYGGVRGRGAEGRGERESSEGGRTNKRRFGYLIFLIFVFCFLFFVSRCYFFFIVSDIYHVLLSKV